MTDMTLIDTETTRPRRRRTFGLSRFKNAAGRARYQAAQGARIAWYAGHYLFARRTSAPFDRPDEPAFRPKRAANRASMRRAFFEAFTNDRANIEAGLYPAPRDVRLAEFPGALRSSARFLADVPEVDRRRLERNGVEVRELEGADRFPVYYRQNFHYQSGGWLTDESADVYDTQVEVLFTGAADVMRRAALAEIALELQGRDQRQVAYLDLACGSGRFLRQVLEAFPRLNAIGADLSPNYVAAARKATAPFRKAEIIEAAAEATPFDDGRFDIVTSVYLFHELPPKVRRQVAQEIARILKPGGVFIFCDALQYGDDPGLDGLLEYFPEGFHEPYFSTYAETDFAQVFGEAGLVSKGPPRRSFLTKAVCWKKPLDGQCGS